MFAVMGDEIEKMVSLAFLISQVEDYGVVILLLYVSFHDGPFCISSSLQPWRCILTGTIPLVFFVCCAFL